ncbi:hypothetical protein ILYODFUR_029675 [Ilyodon furcidens]|uniref:Uncharacterized protein n=1 Tax=Ilyodon furcidens TaxID=33524 RepID=A0ABV0UNZ5_9TELE
MLMWISLDLKPQEPLTWKTYHCCNQPRLWSTQVPYMSCLDNITHELALDVLCMHKRSESFTGNNCGLYMWQNILPRPCKNHLADYRAVLFQREEGLRGEVNVVISSHIKRPYYDACRSRKQASLKTMSPSEAAVVLFAVWHTRYIHMYLLVLFDMS